MSGSDDQILVRVEYQLESKAKEAFRVFGGGRWRALGVVGMPVAIVLYRELLRSCRTIERAMRAEHYPMVAACVHTFAQQHNSCGLRSALKVRSRPFSYIVVVHDQLPGDGV